MRKIVLLSCVSKKNFETAAENLYDSPLFNYALKYTKSCNPDKIYILSALYGLLETSERIKPYNKTLKEMSTTEGKNGVG